VTPPVAGKDWPAAVVACVVQTGLNLMRDLARKGVTVAGIDWNPGHPGFRSAYGRSFVCPNPDDEPGPWLDFMRAFSRRFPRRPVLVPAADLFVSAIGRHARELEEHYVFPVEAIVLQAALATKEQQYALATSAGFFCSRNAYIRDAEDLQRFAESARFPCLLKPRHEREWKDLPAGHALHARKLAVAPTPERLLEIYRSVQPLRAEAVAQEIVDGPDNAKYVYLVRVRERRQEAGLLRGARAPVGASDLRVGEHRRACGRRGDRGAV
jgi:predicted ATP-grasp superfamily ATP-dependent carboligase